MPTAEVFLQRYSIESESKAMAHRDWSLTNTTEPTLDEICTMYGTKTARAWLYQKLAHIALITGAKKDVDVTAQITDATMSLLDNYGNIKTTWLMLFFSMFKAGEYGKFFGAFDTLTIADALNKHIAWCRRTIGLIEQRKAAAEREAERQRRLNDPRCMSYEEWQAKKRQIRHNKTMIWFRINNKKHKIS